MIFTSTTFASLISVALAASTARASVFEGALEALQIRESLNASAGSSAASSASTASGSSSSSSSSSAVADNSTWPGFVNNNTVGTFPCARPQTAQGQTAQLIYSPYSVPGKDCADALPPVYPYNEIRLRASDDSIRATFLPYGARLTEMWVKDRDGAWQDIVVGLDNSTNYVDNTNFLGPIVGRYANRIKNGTFQLDGKTYHVPKNENGLDSLHGGTKGYDQQSWILESVNSSSITFKHHDPAGNQGFPSEVNTTAVYSLHPNSEWKATVHSTASGRTPIMLSSHDYWNLNPQGLINIDKSEKAILEHVLHMPYASKHVKTDGILIPTGELPESKNTPYDFTTARPLSERYNDTEGICGTGCKGWDSCFIEPKGHPNGKPSLEAYSPASGIKMSIKTNQEAWQMYSTAKALGVPRKAVHGGDGTLDKTYDAFSAMVIEAEDWIDGINQPEWGRQDKQIFGKGKDYHWYAHYSFSTVDKNGKAM